MSALRSILAQFDIAVNSSELDEGVSKIDSFVGKLKTVGVVMAAIAAAKGFAHWAEGVAEHSREIEFNAARMEMQVDEYQKLAQVGKNYGMTLENLQIANTLFVRALSGVGGTMGEFSGKTVHARDALRNLGVDARQFKGKGLLEILPVIAGAMEKITDPMERVAIGLRLFGHRGRSIMPMLAQGAEELRRQFAAMVPVFEQATIESAKKATVAGNQLSQTWDNLVNNSIGKAALNMFTWVANKLTNIVLVIKGLTKNSEIGSGVIVAFGAALVAVAVWATIAWAGFIIPVLAVLAAFAALALIVDDFIVFMKGGHSVIGAFFNDLLGPGGATTARDKIKEVWETVKGFLADVKTAVGGEFFKALKEDAATLMASLREIRDVMQWIANHTGTPKVDPAGPAAGYGFGPGSIAGNAGQPGGVNNSYPGVANIPVPYTAGGNLGGVDHRPTPGEVNKGITFNMIGTIDPQRLAEEIRYLAEKTMREHQEQALKGALAAAGGAK